MEESADTFYALLRNAKIDSIMLTMLISTPLGLLVNDLSKSFVEPLAYGITRKLFSDYSAVQRIWVGEVYFDFRLPILIVGFLRFFIFFGFIIMFVYSTRH